MELIAPKYHGTLPERENKSMVDNLGSTYDNFHRHTCPAMNTVNVAVYMCRGHFVMNVGFNCSVSK